MRGDGRIFQRGTVWWVAFYAGGVEQRESTRVSGDRGQRAATSLLRRRLGEIATGQYLGPEAERITVGEVIEGYLGDLRLRGAVSVRALESYRPRLDALAAIRVRALKPEDVQGWMQGELDCGAARGTVKLIAAYLRAALGWAYRSQRVARVPYIPSLRVENARQGFVEAGQMAVLEMALPEVYRDVARFAVASGWRIGEYLPLTWSQVDRAAGQIRLTTSKNGEGRVLPIVGPIAEVIERRARDRVVGCPAIFHRRGRPIPEGSFRAAFGRAAMRAGLGDLSPHDLRRTAVRDMVHAGVPERVAMGVTGHKTRAVFDRYCIVRPADLAEAVAKADRRRTMAMAAR